MAKSNPGVPDAPEDGIRLGDASVPLTDGSGPALKDPRAQAAIDNIGVDDQADLLDPELDEQPGDRDASGRSFADDVRSDAQGAGIRESGDS
ncbi:hypothetical protein [Pseudoxanthomonas suwonensis]|uniref:Uncharacterized protein n=1 Tax=Pseudoxanthomonas suwonensis TaxID=314722 RepID=A0A0E3YZU3_9GAMM|nr:hypothetical protein [Pseudoxanthomonas suwonensis]AKC85787.1 hypothetical protein WQ53_02440 [Pseudoxanthomonas suwonensis]